MIVRAKHNFFIYNFLKIYTLWKIKRNFHKVHFRGELKDKGLPLLVISNHISWWDGFWVMFMNLKYFHRKFHFMMLEEQLDRYSFFKSTGGFSVKKGSRSVIQTICHARELLSNQDNMVLLFPQGEIQSIYKTSFSFEKGVERILEDSEGEIQIILNANFIDYHSEQKPTLYMFLRESRIDNLSSAAMEKEYNEFYSSSLEALINNSVV